MIGAKQQTDVASKLSKKAGTEAGVKSSNKADHAEAKTGAKSSVKSCQSVKDTGVKITAKALLTEKEPDVKKEYKLPHPNQCGLENDGSVWFKNTPAPRITICRESAKDQAKYRSIIDSILHFDTLYGKRVNFDPNDVQMVMVEVRKYLKSEPILIEDVPCGVTIVGDLHGQLYDLDRVFNIHAKDGKPGYLGSKFVFMGDYVDRGQQSLEVIMLLFCLKMLYPDSFFLLRGNHEFARINCCNGFADEIGERYCKETAPYIFAQCNEAFCFLSLAAIVGGKYLCVHGGISPRYFTRFTLSGIRKPIIHCTADVIIQDMMWSDPGIGLQGTVFNYDRGCSIHFGLDVLVYALHSIQCIALFRGHTKVKGGYDNQWDVCHTVFTATGKNNDGAVAIIKGDGKLAIKILVKSEKQLAIDELLFGKDSPDQLTVEDNGTVESKDDCVSEIKSFIK